MARPPITPIEKTPSSFPGRDNVETERHPSWVLVGVSKISGRTRLFESELEHQHYIRLRVETAERERDLHRSWLSSDKTILEIDMSLSQWGAIVSSPNQGTGNPATLVRFHHPEGLPEGPTPEAEHESQLARSFQEVKESGHRMLEYVREAQEAVQEAFDNNLGKKVMRERLNRLQSMVQNAPNNMEFAAKSLTEHIDNTVSKARADIETMVQAAIIAGEPMQLESGSTIAGRLIGTGEEVTDVEGVEVADG